MFNLFHRCKISTPSFALLLRINPYMHLNSASGSSRFVAVGLPSSHKIAEITKLNCNRDDQNESNSRKQTLAPLLPSWCRQAGNPQYWSAWAGATLEMSHKAGARGVPQHSSVAVSSCTTSPLFPCRSLFWSMVTCSMLCMWGTGAGISSRGFGYWRHTTTCICEFGIWALGRSLSLPSAHNCRVWTCQKQKTSMQRYHLQSLWRVLCPSGSVSPWIGVKMPSVTTPELLH